MTIKVEVTLNARQFRTAFNRLPKSQRLRLVEDFERSTWPDRFGRLLKRIRRRSKSATPLSDGEIVRICREARQDIYELTRRRRSR